MNHTKTQNSYFFLMSDDSYKKAKQLNLTNRTVIDENHHEKSIELFNFISANDSNDYDNHFNWKSEQGKINASILMRQLNTFFKYKDIESIITANDKSPFKIKRDNPESYQLMFKDKVIADGNLPDMFILSFVDHMNYGYQQGLKDSK